MNKKSGGNLFLAGIFGAIAGAIGGLLLAPQSGKETREDIARISKELANKMKTKAVDTKKKVMDVFGETSQAAVDKYTEIRTAVTDKLAALKNAGNNIDKDKYGEVVDQVVDGFKDDFKATKAGAKKMAKLLKNDWNKVKSALN
ncbi:TPA: hypothetical protein DIC29_02165 [Candidatus Shapirobacteria bacterium]|uniref:Gas vesicle protein n=2 Tax=Patescibacteria group TaxID=1783273 RepID=A0A1F6YJ83_9BACT|nr:MAG: hypothetical protein A2192_02535 [Candidatus Nomurabacteria bacterium RIFOXYA1_FULL_35_17]HCU55245.1 hypothetical protein [Candidatus Shapirobacteria bacterium]